MLTNYFLIALRLFVRRKLYSLINALGLGIAMAFGLLTFLFIQNELAFDQFHEDKERIFLLKITSLDEPAYSRGEVNPYTTRALLSNGMCESLSKEVPEVEALTMFRQNPGILKKDDNSFEAVVYFVDTSFFDVFTFPIVTGSISHAFQQPQDLIISEKAAMKYFSSTDVVGRSVTLEINGVQVQEYVIQAVARIPAVSSLQFEMLISMSNYPYTYPKTWNNYNYKACVKLWKDADILRFKSKADTLIAQNRSDWIDRARKEYSLPKEMTVEELAYTPIHEIHFDKEAYLSVPASDKQYSWILSGIALLIMIIACINYISFSLASLVNRRKEIGIRKTNGATGFEIFKQFNLESITLAAFAALLGSAIALTSLPLFNELAGKTISIAELDLTVVTLVIVLLVLVLGLFSGSYPGLVVSRFEPAAIFRSTYIVKSTFMKTLVVLQFTVSSFLMISSIIMYSQMRFIATTDLGFNDKAVIAVPTNLGWNEESDKSIERFRQKVKGDRLIENVSGTVSSFAKGHMGKTFSINDQEIMVRMNKADEDYLSLFDIPLVQGRNFREGIPADSNAIIVNEALVKTFGWNDPLNKELGPSGNSKDRLKVIGVMKDFHFESLDHEIQPLLLTSSVGDFHFITLLVRLNPENITEALGAAKSAWKSLYPDKPFSYTFVDEDVAHQYESHERWMMMIGIATALAVIIACLGLFGLAGIQAVNRTKEICIRKVLGADVPSLFLMLNKPFVYMALIAFILATPASWYIMNKWMTNFKYHINIGWELFAISMSCALLVALASISYHGIRTVKVNPAETLKSE
jgi:putative ABC transport system permease protein